MNEINFKTLLPGIKLMVFDVDGVLTDGSVLCFNDGEQIRNMNIKDGYALQLAIKKNIRILIISGGRSEAVIKRLNMLGVTDIFMSVQHKLPVLIQYLFEFGINPNEVLYMGDDIPDLECLKYVAAATCPADAAHDIKNVCNYVSHELGGRGCVRDVIEQVLRAQKMWLDADAHTW
ncbi:MAG: HAD hydrolase family protein [Bacteroidia bacterium]|nr:HAD hydrolase family protein [Bacteroidia bacterium]MCZ2249040.1 3-deoxy-D-manno-octulosonate 8-phosphate phosphatase [Bacteroidia bacterium]